MSRQSGWVRFAFTVWSLFILVPLMIVAWRAGTQHHYVWGLLAWSGPGPLGAYWKVIVAAITGWAMITGLAKAGRGAWLGAAAWHGFFAVGVTMWYLGTAVPITVQGDAWGWKLEFGMLLPLLMILTTCVALGLYISRMAIQPVVAHFSRQRRMILIGAVLMSIPIGILFVIGAYNGTEDSLSIGLVVIQCFALAGILVWPGPEQRLQSAAS